MNNLTIKLHQYQLLILKQLATKFNARFNELLIEGLESEHMNYHLQKLVTLGLISKNDTHYLLTDNGKDYLNLMDDNVEIIEKQPKTSVILRVIRKNTTTNKIEHLLCKRLKQPYLGKVGALTGKVHFGETLVQAAERELYEETGLKAKTVVLINVYHKLRHNKEGVFIQDVLFYSFFITDTFGEFIAKTPWQENFWISKSDLEKRTDLDLFDDLKLSDDYSTKKLSFSESVAVAEGF